MKKAIYYEGPITVGYRVTADFYAFQPTATNYYSYCADNSRGCDMVGGHAVTIVGWKKIGDVPVWIVKNSWGQNWGYGFPNAPTITNPDTNQTVLKYPGGFWNHIMGKNDSFIESNAEGAHPNLHVPQLSQYIPSTVPENWFETMTLRDIYNHTGGKPLPSPSNGVIPLPPLITEHKKIWVIGGGILAVVILLVLVGYLYYYFVHPRLKNKYPDMFKEYNTNEETICI